jgi:alpha-L-glutamate ligase-like protein
MAVSKDILGMNARNFLYIRKYNKASAKRRADDKLATKNILLGRNIATPALLASFYERKDITDFTWDLPKDGFVIKPARGYGGAGILPVRSWNGDEGETATGQPINRKELGQHILDILDGAYSLQYLPDKAFIEERILLHPFFKKLVPVGIPDIRIIVFQKVPVMAMLRLPTAESGGKANLHLGAVGIGIDIRTGITTYAVSKDKITEKIPDVAIKPRGIKIPDWESLLLLASRTEQAIRLGYAGVDIVFDSKKGPVVLEVNARPGLAIQLANMASLRTRLERIEGMTISTPERGVEVAKSLFAEEFSEKVSTSPKVLSVIQDVTLHGKNGKKTVQAKLDTGAFRSSIDEQLAKELGLAENQQKVFVRSASGERYRPTVSITFELAGKRISGIASTVDRSGLAYPMIVGRKDLKDFLIKPVIEHGEEQDEIEETAH